MLIDEIDLISNSLMSEYNIIDKIQQNKITKNSKEVIFIKKIL